MPGGGKSNDVRERESVRLRFQAVASGAGLSRVNHDVLSLRHMWSKREDVKPSEDKERLRLKILFSGSPYALAART